MFLFMLYQIHVCLFFIFNNYFYTHFFFAVVLSDDEWPLFGELPELEDVTSDSDVRRESLSNTPPKRLAFSKKRKASDEGHKDKGKGKKTRKGLTLKHFTFFNSVVTAALYFFNEIIVKRLSKGYCDNRNDVSKFLSVAGIVDLVMPKWNYFDEFPYDEVLISNLLIIAKIMTPVM